MKAKKCKFFERKNVNCGRCGKRIHKGKMFSRSLPGWETTSEKEQVVLAGEVYKEVQMEAKAWVEEEDYCNKCEQRRK